MCARRSSKTVKPLYSRPLATGSLAVMICGSALGGWPRIWFVVEYDVVQVKKAKAKGVELKSEEVIAEKDKEVPHLPCDSISA